MTTRDMYNALLQDCRYKPDEYYPSKRCIDRKDIKHMNFNNVRIDVDGYSFKAHGVELTSDYYGTTVTASAHLDPDIINRSNLTNTLAEKYRYTTPTCNKTSKYPTIENVIFNPPATIVFWSDKTKTIVKCDYDYEYYDPEKGIAMAIAKKLMGDNKGNYYELFKHWRKKWDEQTVATEHITGHASDITKSPIEKFADSVRSVFNVDDLLP